MNPLTQHPTDQGVTYREHFGFAMGVAKRLLISVLSFAIHALLPFIGIEPKNDLEATAAFLLEQNRWIESASQSHADISYRDHRQHSPLPG